MINIYIKNVTSKIENLPSYLNNIILDKLIVTKLSKYKNFNSFFLFYYFKIIINEI